MVIVMLSPGDTAPTAALQDQSAEPFNWKSIKGKRALIFFYPKASTPGCTQQACGLRDVVGQVGDTQIIGVSPDKPTAQKKFADKYELPYPLLADTEHELAEAYGVWKEKSMYGRKYMGIERSAFLVGPKGKIEQAWYKISPKDTPLKLLEALKA
jgi:thioredoxin-dependent peroxiredoxin